MLGTRRTLGKRSGAFRANLAQCTQRASPVQSARGVDATFAVLLQYALLKEQALLALSPVALSCRYFLLYYAWLFTQGAGRTRFTLGREVVDSGGVGGVSKVETSGAELRKRQETQPERACHGKNKVTMNAQHLNQAYSLTRTLPVWFYSYQMHVKCELSVVMTTPCGPVHGVHASAPVAETNKSPHFWHAELPLGEKEPATKKRTENNKVQTFPFRPSSRPSLSCILFSSVFSVSFTLSFSFCVSYVRSP